MMKGVGYVCAYTGVGIWFGGAAMVMSWAGHRPLAPDALHPYAYNNHGMMYVSVSDLWWSRGTIAAGALLFAIAFLIRIWIRTVDPKFE